MKLGHSQRGKHAASAWTPSAAARAAWRQGAHGTRPDTGTASSTQVLDGRGLEFPNFRAARDEAFRTCGEMLRQIPSAINNGDPFQLWVTDQPEGKGKKLLTLTVLAETG